MAHGICHARRNRLTGKRGSQTGASQGTATQTRASQGTATTDGSSQRTTPAAPPEEEPPKKRGRKPGSRTKLKPLSRTGQVTLKPSGDRQFSYANYEAALYKYTTQLGVILKREYLACVLQDRDEDGVLIRERPALDWPDYFLGTTDIEGRINGDRVLYEFWRLFQVQEEDQAEADRVPDEYLKKRVRDMMYQARVDCVKQYYRDRGESLDDTLAHTIELEYEQYKEGTSVWTTQGTPINAFAAMKSGMKNIDSSGNCGPINSSKAQQRMDDYIAGAKRVTQAHREYEEDREHEQPKKYEDMEEVEQGQGQGPGHEQELNAKVLFDVSGGMSTHGRFAIGNGVVRAANVRAAEKEKNVSQSNSVSMQMLAQQNAQLRRENARLRKEKDSADSALQ